MKAIISHDIDHITAGEHIFRDLIVPKFMVRSQIEWLSGKISGGEYFGRWGELFGNKWNNLQELVAFNRAAGITSSFFIGVEKGTGLNYSLEAATVIIRQLQESSCELGLHGIRFENKEVIAHEQKLFAEISGLQSFGVRMHYVRMNENTLSNMNEASFTYDSSVSEMKNPYKVGNMWEFPIQVMDSWIMENGKSWQSRTLEQAREATIRIIDEAEAKHLDYLSIDFHDRYFSSRFSTWMNWYTWLVEYLEQRSIKCVTFGNAMAELEQRA
ncbi:MAG TPA: hypothetical protein VK826_17250 [Bacteroidia bacterium]|nr:hypothetical protein [Bacteroidia bacterium]